MVTYKQMHSILLMDGRKHLVDIDDWANVKLRGVQPEEYDQFASDYLNEITPYHQELVNSGRVISTDITEIIPDSDIRILVGRQYTWVSGEKEDHPKHLEWQAKFAADPAVTYNPLILVIE